MQHLLDTPIKIATCNRCRSYVFTCQVVGIRTTVDPTPLDVQGYRGALLAGRTTYDVIEQSGRPWRLRPRGPASPIAGHSIVASHGCGASAMDATGVTEAAPVPPTAPVNASGGSGTPAALSTPHRGVQASALAITATPHRSKPLRCATCGHLIDVDRPYWAIEHPSMQWAVHDECP